MLGKIREPINMIAANDKKYTTRKMIAEIIYSEYFIIHLFSVCIEYTIGFLACIGLISCRAYRDVCYMLQRCVVGQCDDDYDDVRLQ